MKRNAATGPCLALLFPADFPMPSKA